MPFGVTNAPSVFMDLMNWVFHMYLDWFTPITMKIWRTLEDILREKKLFVKLKKCEFWLERVTFLGHVISKDGVVVDPGKIKAMMDWERPTNVWEIRSFLRLTGYYRRFVDGFAKLARPLTALTKKNAHFT